jgi:hypothetical protein
MTIENNPEPSADDKPEEKTSPALKKEKSVGKFLFRGLTYLSFLIFFLIMSVGLVLEFFFPAERFRLLAEDQISQQLKLPLTIKKISFSLLSGIQVDDITLGSAIRPLAHIKQIILNYDLTQLLQGKLVINQVLLDHPQLTAISQDGVWNFLPLLKPESRSRPSAPADKTSPLPSFPLPEIDIKALTLRNASAHLEQDGKLNAYIEGLSLEAQGKISRKNLDLKLKVLLQPDKNEKPNISFQSTGDISFESRVDTDLNFSANDFNQFLLSGTFGLHHSQTQLGTASLPSPDIRVEMDTEVSLKPEVVNLKKFWMSLDNNNHIKVAGRVVNFSKDPSLQLQVNEASFQLQELLVWGKQWLPPLTGQGLLKAEAVQVRGELSGFTLKKLNVNGGTLSTKNLWLTYPSQNAKIEDLNAQIELEEIALHDSQLGKATIKIEMQLKKGQAQKIEVLDWNQSLNLNTKGKNEILWQFNTDIKSLHFDHPETRKIFIPVHAEGSGHLIKNDLDNLKLSYHLGTLVNGKATGNFKDFGKNSIKFNQSLTLNLAEVANLLPKKFSTHLAEDFKGTAQAQTSIDGKLDAEFLPAELKGTANIQVDVLSAGLKQPALNIKNLSTRISFPLEFRFDKGVRIPNIDIHAELLNAEAEKAWKIDAVKFDTKIMTQAFYNLKPNFGTLPVQIDTHIALGSINNYQPTLSLTDFKADLTLEADLLSDDVRNTRVEGKLSFKNLSAMETLNTGGGVSRFHLDVHDKSLTRVYFSQKTQINKPSINQNGLKTTLASVSLETKSRQDLKNGAVSIDTFILQLPELVNARLKATLKQWGKSFDAEGHIENLQIGALWNHVPVAFKAGMENLNADGTLGITLRTKGRLPIQTQKDRGEKPLWTQLLVPAQLEGQAPVELEAIIQLDDGFLVDPDKNLRAENLSTQTHLTLKNGNGNLSGNIFGQLTGLTETPLIPEFNFSYDLNNMNILRVKQHHLTLKNYGVEHSLEGSIKGVKSFITGQHPLDAHELLSRMDINLTQTNSLHISQADSANVGKLPGNIKAQGGIASKLNLHQSAGKTLSLDGNIQFDKFSLHLPSGIMLSNLNGTFPFTKTLSLDPKQPKKKSNHFSPAQKKFFTPLRDFSRYKNIIHVDDLKIKGQSIKNIGLDAVFKDNRLMAEKFIFDILGGSVGGNLFLTQDQEGPVLKFSTEFAGLDSSKLLAPSSEKAIDAKVDGNLQVALKIKTGSEGQPVALDQLSIQLAITRIGAQTLDRLLLFLDPEESKPAIMDTRAKLKLATPHQVIISLKNGNLDVEAWLKSDLLGIFKAPELKRVPVAALKRFNTLQEHLQTLKSLQPLSNYLSARGLQFEDKKMILHY